MSATIRNVIQVCKFTILEKPQTWRAGEAHLVKNVSGGSEFHSKGHAHNLMFRLSVSPRRRARWQGRPPLSQPARVLPHLFRLAPGQPSSLWMPRRALCDNRKSPTLLIVLAIDPQLILSRLIADSHLCGTWHARAKIYALQSPLSWLCHAARAADENPRSAKRSFIAFPCRASRRRKSARDRIGFRRLILQAAVLPG